MKEKEKLLLHIPINEGEFVDKQNFNLLSINPLTFQCFQVINDAICTY